MLPHSSASYAIRTIRVSKSPTAPSGIGFGTRVRDFPSSLVSIYTGPPIDRAGPESPWAGSRAIVETPTMSQAPQADDARQSGDSLDAWFKREILTHEGALVRYLSRMWPNRQDIVDLRQDTYVRVYEAAAKTRPAAPKSFLFATARHLMTDRFRRQRIVSIDSVGDVDALNVLIEDVSPERHMSAHQELRRLARAIDLLPRKCREAVWMRRVDDLPQKEVAARLGVTEKVIEKHVMKGMRLLADVLARSRGETLAEGGREVRHDRETDRGKP